MLFLLLLLLDATLSVHSPAFGRRRHRIPTWPASASPHNPGTGRPLSQTVGDRVAGRERNKAQEAKDEKFETIGDRVRARTELGGGLGETKSPKRIVAGLKASLKNPNTSAEKKKELREKLRELVSLCMNRCLLFPPRPHARGECR